MDIGLDLARLVGPERVRRNAPLAPVTTFRVGGPADWLVEVHDARELVEVIRIVRGSGLPLTVLGGGSNVLIGDGGVRGVVVRTKGGRIGRLQDDLVRADAGVTINGLVRWTINRGLAGLEAWAGTPGTVGGGIWGNAHFQGRLLGELIASVQLLSPEGQVVDVPVEGMEFGYDRSRLQRTGELLVSGTFRVERGDPLALRRVARESLAFRKRTQPLASSSAGCIFQNPEPGRDSVPAGIPPSAGALIDHAGLKDRSVGEARVSGLHGNFIVNEGQATAADIRALIQECRRGVREKFGVDLREEIVYLGEFEGEPRGSCPHS
jgi:UDP-N-acetylmuramate dehydrogenase